MANDDVLAKVERNAFVFTTLQKLFGVDDPQRIVDFIKQLLKFAATCLDREGLLGKAEVQEAGQDLTKQLGLSQRSINELLGLIDWLVSFNIEDLTEKIKDLGVVEKLAVIKKAFEVEVYNLRLAEKNTLNFVARWLPDDKWTKVSDALDDLDPVIRDLIEATAGLSSVSLKDAVIAAKQQKEWSDRLKAIANGRGGMKIPDLLVQLERESTETIRCSVCQALNYLYEEVCQKCAASLAISRMFVSLTRQIEEAIPPGADRDGLTRGVILQEKTVQDAFRKMQTVLEEAIGTLGKSDDTFDWLARLRATPEEEEKPVKKEIDFLVPKYEELPLIEPAPERVVKEEIYEKPLPPEEEVKIVKERPVSLY